MMKRRRCACRRCAAGIAAHRGTDKRRCMMTRIEQSIEVNVPVGTAYRQLTQFEQYPRFMEDVEEVRQVDDTHLHWHTKAGHLDMEWDAEITQQVPDRCIAWRNLNGPRYEGRIDLRPTEQGRTEVKLTMECEPRQQVLAQHGDAQRAIVERAEHDLARFKKFIEKLGEATHDWLGKLKDAEPLATDAGEAKPSGAVTVRQEASRPALKPQRAVSGLMDEAWPAMTGMPWLSGYLRAWSDPLALMRRMSEDADRMMSRIAGTGMQAMQTQAPAWAPPLEVAQRNGQFVVSAELAGVRREDVSVEITGDRLTIEGERKPLAPRGPQEFRRSERAYGHFCRVVSLPPGADAVHASALLQDGVLEITVPLARGGRGGRRIDIQTAG
ncbi:Hsp20 family protein [Herbaspirillum sp. HC18]|nr:Hsp20 family protein [Herbaspirillum sp. HC18]